MTSLDQLIRKHGLESHADQIKAIARPAVAIRAAQVEQSELAPGASRFGGLPHLPKGSPWPRWRGEPLGHVATIRLSELAPLDVEGRLPPRGYLYFWNALADSPWGFDPSEEGFSRVDFIPDESTPLELAAFPLKDLSKFASQAGPEGGVYTPCRLELEPRLTFPNQEWLAEFKPEFPELDYLKYITLTLELEGFGEPKHRLLGHASAVQGPMELECQLVSNGFYCGDARDFDDPRRIALAPGAVDWRLLLQVDSDESGPGWSWCDSGRLYFWIRTQSLAACRFNETWTILQSG